MSALELFDERAFAAAPVTRGLILAADSWSDNAELICDCARLGYLRPEWRTLDPTYGKGNWWTRWQPLELVTHDLARDGVDFRNLPYRDGEFDAVTFDPPYMPWGGDKTTVGTSERYGLEFVGRSVPVVTALIADGLEECTRVLRPKGHLLVKCCDYIWGGAYIAGTHHALTAALELGLELIDRFELVRLTATPNSHKTQVHARRNVSTLFVFKA